MVTAGTWATTSACSGNPIEKLSFGGTFHSGFTINYERPYGNHRPSDHTSANSKWPFPVKAIVGVSYRPTPKWNLEFNADYTDWSALGTVNVTQTSPPGLPTVPVTLNWESSWYYEFGATRYLDNGWHVSAGYIFNENSVPDANYSPLVADLNRHFFSVGVGRKGKNLDFDIAYQFGYGPTRTVTRQRLVHQERRLQLHQPRHRGLGRDGIFKWRRPANGETCVTSSHSELTRKGTIIPLFWREKWFILPRMSKLSAGNGNGNGAGGLLQQSKKRTAQPPPAALPIRSQGKPRHFSSARRSGTARRAGAGHASPRRLRIVQSDGRSPALRGPAKIRRSFSKGGRFIPGRRWCAIWWTPAARSCAKPRSMKRSGRT